MQKVVPERLLDMNIKALSDNYSVRKIEDADVLTVLKLCEGNKQYYQHCPPMVTEESIRADMQALPPKKGIEDKYYVGFYDGEKLVAVLDLIVEYPNEETAFIGFFMMCSELQGRGIGTLIVNDVCACLKKDFAFVRLGYVDSNKQSEQFWRKNHFMPTGVVSKTENYNIVILQRAL